MSFSRYNTEDSVISSETVVRGLWSGDSNTFQPSFTNTSSYGEYFLNVYDGSLSVSSSTVQYSIQYGNISGSGSNWLSSASGSTPSRIVYGEYRNLVYGTEVTNFSFNSDVTSSSNIFVINVARSRYKESLLPGSFSLSLVTGSGATSSSIRLIDDSLTTNLTRFIGENKVFYIIQSGSANPTEKYYGMLFPDLNIIILNATAGSSGSITPYIPSIASSFAVNNNQLKLHTSIVSGSINNFSGSAVGFSLKSSETVSSRYFFTRVKNSEFNYTTNPSIIDANGNLLFTTLIDNPQTYVTTVGMYNDNNELLAVAKLSKPLTKDFTKEALIRIKLDY